MHVQFNKKIILAFLVAAALFFITANLLTIFLKFTYEFDIKTIFYKLSLDHEGNIPTFFSSTILLISSLMLFLIATFHRLQRSSAYIYWLGLSLLFLFLAFDEGASIHEYIIKIFWRFYEPSDYDNYVWPV
ncbi:MAG: hypothetical protein WD185_01175, partial [Sneathiella sp.]